MNVPRRRVQTPLLCDSSANEIKISSGLAPLGREPLTTSRCSSLLLVALSLRPGTPQRLNAALVYIVYAFSLAEFFTVTVWTSRCELKIRVIGSFFVNGCS